MLSPTPRRRAVLAACSFLLAFGALLLTGALLQHARAVAAALQLPPNEPDRGLIYDGLQIVPGGSCGGLYLLPLSGLCTHGPDPAPDGTNVPTAAAPAPALAGLTAAAHCADDGTSGYRTQVIYARASDNLNGDRYASYLASFRQWVAATDVIYDASAIETGGDRHIRFVTDGACAVTVLNVVLSPAGDDTFDTTISELQGLGYNRPDRRYLVFMDANVLCGIGTLFGDDRASADNYNNGGYAGYGRVDIPCWGAHTLAHELMHTLGGVQNTAPHATGGSHCYDEFDVMCYIDLPPAPALLYLCLDITHDDRFDCNHDDYYNTNPPAGSYLATHWNAANSRFLIAGGAAPSPGPSASPGSGPSPLPTSSPNPIPSPGSSPSPGTTPSPGPATSPAPSPSSSPAPGTYQLTLQATSGGWIAPLTSGRYPAGRPVTLRAMSADGYLFTGWTIDNADRGWANPLSLTIDADHTVRANFAARPQFGDLPTGDPASEAVAQLAARGVIRGYDPTTFGPGDRVLRAQMAALIARAMGWSGTASSNPFTDRCDPANPADCVDAELWGAVGQLAGRNVARGYSDPAACAPSAAPCYAPRDNVLQAQVLSFIARVLVAKGYWQQQPTDPNLYGGALNGTGHEQDVATFVHYTQDFGGVPDYPAGGSFPGWNQPATRAWFARALWAALQSYWGIDRVP
jgi:hypothetical protein